MMKSSAKKRKLGGSLTTALAGLLLLGFLMGNPGSVLAANAEEDTGGVDYTEKVAMSAENNYGADVLIPVELIPQNPELPNGCEITALTMLLRQAGFGIDKVTMAKYFMPKEEFREVTVAGKKDPVLYGGDPEKVYAGDPMSKDNGFYCFQDPIIKAASLFFEEQKSPLKALDLSGAPVSGLVGLVDQGTPVMVWCTLRMDSLRNSTKKSWVITETGETYVPYSNVHAMVLVGYNDEDFYLNDPLNGLVTCPKDKFMQVFEQLGSRAVVIM